MAAVLQFRRFQGKHGLSRWLPLLHPNLRSGDQLRHQTHVQAVSPNPVAGHRQRGYGERDRGSGSGEVQSWLPYAVHRAVAEFVLFMPDLPSEFAVKLSSLPP
ncbi:hypothetical protein SASPL_107927 [Salvia splendens]|uniref:Uncharacterized protein n=1 Tax=Salvia splendens TaxID=180675 RepID=A0A8X9A4W7_SALSN|nr:hypothetical protein SASPL_107927 [Salvia splendens]